MRCELLGITFEVDCRLIPPVARIHPTLHLGNKSQLIIITWIIATCDLLSVRCDLFSIKCDLLSNTFIASVNGE